MNKSRKTSISLFEQTYPLGVAVILLFCGFLMWNNFVILYDTSFDNVLNAVITFSSILVGFIGVLLGLLFSANNSTIIKKMFSFSEKYILKRYFYESIISGIILVFVSVGLFLRDTLSTITSVKISNVDLYGSIVVFWVALIAYVLLSAWRIVKIIMHIIFSDDKDENESQEEITMEKEAEKELQDRFKKN